MPRPGPRPYECVRRAWHCDSHQALRGSLTQEIFRIVTEFHSSETRRKKEWQEKLPIVVLRAEEILYSKARTEAEYSDFSTLKPRLEDAVNTMIRRTDDTTTGSKDGPYMEPCVEAALSLGCTPKINPRNQRPSNNARLNTKRGGGSSPTPSQNAPVVPASYLTNIIPDKAWPPTKVIFGAEGPVHGYPPQTNASNTIFNMNNNFRGPELVRNEFENWQNSGSSSYHHQQQRQQFLFNHNASQGLGMIFPPPQEIPAFRDVPSQSSQNHGNNPRNNFVTYGTSQFQAGDIFPASFAHIRPLPETTGNVMRKRIEEDDLELCLAPPKGNLDPASLSWPSEGPLQQVGERLPCLKRKSLLHEDKFSDVTSFEASKRIREYPY